MSLSRRPRTSLALILCATALTACDPGPSEEEVYAALGPRYEARAWLTANANPYALASNRFESTAAAAAFVDTLYALGADSVFVTNVQEDSAWILEEGGPYADALWIRVPDDRARRRDLFAIVTRESEREGFDPQSDRGQTLLFLWWD